MTWRFGASAWLPLGRRLLVFGRRLVEHAAFGTKAKALHAQSDAHPRRFGRDRIQALGGDATGRGEPAEDRGIR